MFDQNGFDCNTYLLGERFWVCSILRHIFKKLDLAGFGNKHFVFTSVVDR